MKVKLFALLVLFINLVACSEPPYTNLNNAELEILLNEGVPLYDIRRPDEWKQTGLVKGSHKLTFVDSSGKVNPGFISLFTQAVGKDEPVILICRTGNRTNSLARHLIEQLGYTQVYNVNYGITSWIREGRKVIHK